MFVHIHKAQSSSIHQNNISVFSCSCHITLAEEASAKYDVQYIFRT